MRPICLLRPFQGGPSFLYQNHHFYSSLKNYKNHQRSPVHLPLKTSLLQFSIPLTYRLKTLKSYKSGGPPISYHPQNNRSIDFVILFLMFYKPLYGSSFPKLKKVFWKKCHIHYMYVTSISYYISIIILTHHFFIDSQSSKL